LKKDAQPSAGGSKIIHYQRPLAAIYCRYMSLRGLICSISLIHCGLSASGLARNKSIIDTRRIYDEVQGITANVENLDEDYDTRKLVKKDK